MWGCEDVLLWGWEVVKIWRCDVKMWKCEDEKMWRPENVKMRRCEDVKMWGCEDDKMRENVKIKDVMWRWEDVKKVDRPPLLEEPFRSDALGKKIVRRTWALTRFVIRIWFAHSCTQNLCGKPFCILVQKALCCRKQGCGSRTIIVPVPDPFCIDIEGVCAPFCGRNKGDKAWLRTVVSPTLGFQTPNFVT
jgi:hypothetical protein